MGLRALTSLLLLLFQFFSVSIGNILIILDKNTDLNSSDWSIKNCKYSDSYGELHDRGFWSSEFENKKCELEYELKGYNSFRIRISGFLTGKGKIEIKIIEESGLEILLGHLKGSYHYLSTQEFNFNVTKNSVLKIVISQSNPPKDSAVLDRVSIEEIYQLSTLSRVAIPIKYSLLQPKSYESTTERPMATLEFTSVSSLPISIIKTTPMREMPSQATEMMPTPTTIMDSSIETNVESEPEPEAETYPVTSVPKMSEDKEGTKQFYPNNKAVEALSTLTSLLQGSTPNTLAMTNGDLSNEAVPEPTAESEPEPTQATASGAAEPEGEAEPKSEEKFTSPAPEPENEPTGAPEPANEPTGAPEPENEPTGAPEPEKEPTGAPEPENEPTGASEPENKPTVAPEPENEPTAAPEPENEPTGNPEPENEPTGAPEPENEPTAEPNPKIEPTGTPEPETIPASPEPKNEPTPAPETEDPSRNDKTGVTGTENKQASPAPEPEPSSLPEPKPSSLPEPKPTSASVEPEATASASKVEGPVTESGYQAQGRSAKEASTPWGLYIGIGAGAFLLSTVGGVVFYMKKKRDKRSINP